MVIADGVSDLVTKYSLLLEQVAEFIVVSTILYGLGRFGIRPFVEWVFGRWGLQPTLERTLEKLLRVILVVGAVVIGAWAAGFRAFVGGSALIFAALTLAVGFAAQDVLSNFVAGVFIVQDRNFNIDDWIEWEDKAGFISDIGFRVTRVRTFDNETITVPNTELATSPVTNRMSNETLRISYGVGISYEDDIDEASRILLDAAGAHDEILTEPSPSVRVAELDETSILLQSRFWIADPDREDFSETRSEYIQSVKERFQAEGFDISTTRQHDITGDITVRDPPAEV